MTDKELKEWEEEAKEADESIKNLVLTIVILGFYIAIFYAMVAL
jgi:hypothetical protein|tara:strand:+ start:3114 stop:3245 length:132 start_codon:yes stop_codon:yes gene_type:complete